MTRRAFSRQAAAGLAAVLLVSVAGEAAAQSASERREARELFEAGVALVEGGDLAGALERFQASFRINPHGIVLFNIAAVQRELGELAAAVESFEAYVAMEGTGLAADRREQIEQIVADLKRQLTAVLVVVNEAGAAVLFDGRSVGMTPFAGPVHVAAGMLEIRVRKAGFDEWVTMVPVPPGEVSRVEVSLVATVVAPGGGAVSGGVGGALPGLGGGGVGPGGGPGEEPVVETAIWEEWWFWTAIGAVVLGAGLGAGLGVGLQDDGGERPATWSVWGR